jgi:acetolactate synthase-1/2/3 large subunit
VARLRDEWQEVLSVSRGAPDVPMSISKALVMLRRELERDAIVVTGAGNPQSQVFQEFDVFEPRTHISSGGFSTMGFTVPGAIGAKLARPDRQVVGIAGDGDYMQTMQELATAVMYRLPIVLVVMNNAGWHSIRSLQWSAYGEERVLATRFLRDVPGGWGDGASKGEPYTPDFAAAARAFGAWAERVEDPDKLPGAIRSALRQDGPAVVEVMTTQNFPLSGITKTGWWDVPVPAYLSDRRRTYDRERSEERLT